MHRAALILAMVPLMGLLAGVAAARADQIKLRFNDNGEFTIVLFTDIQDRYPIDPRTIRAMEAILDRERPDFVMLGGDLSSGAIRSADEFRRYAEQLARPMEERGIPWGHVFGNHDEDHLPATGLAKRDQQAIYESFPLNISSAGEEGVWGVGNYVLPVYASTGDDIVFAIWALDSGRYLQDNNGWYGGRLEQDAVLPNGLQGSHNYDFVKFSQIMWYWNRSVALEQEAGHKVPGLLFMHIPLPEHRLIHMNPAATGMVGEKNEDVFNSPINSGLFAAILQRGDIKGVYVGHDHVNTYVGRYAGIDLGYAGSIGFGTYGLSGADRDRLRGARVFRISERDPANYRTYMVLASEVVPDLQTALITAGGTVQHEPVAGRILFHDDFERAELGPAWTVYDARVRSEPSNWRIVSGVLTQSSNIYRVDNEYDHWQGSNLVAGSADWTDYELSFKMGSFDDDGMGALFRYQDENNYYRFIMVQDPTNRGPFRRLEKYVDGKRYVLAESRAGYTPNKAYSVAIRLVGDHISVYLDGEKILEARDGTFRSGKIGFVVYANDGLQVDDVTVVALEDGARP